nr:MSHA biogenesis protein MshA [Vibrio navarrensis]
MELVVVIVILGILAVTAAPRFLNLQEDARGASLQGLKGAIDGAAGIVYGKAAIAGLDSTASAAKLSGGQVIFGYPTATSASLGAFVNGLTQDWTASGGASTAGAIVQFSFIGNTNWAAAPNGCYVQYQAAQSTTSSAVTTVVDGGC